jgi:hypothetical protein
MTDHQAKKTTQEVLTRSKQVKMEYHFMTARSLPSLECQTDQDRDLVQRIAGRCPRLAPSVIVEVGERAFNGASTGPRLRREPLSSSASPCAWSKLPWGKLDGSIGVLCFEGQLAVNKLDRQRLGG